MVIVVVKYTKTFIILIAQSQEYKNCNQIMEVDDSIENIDMQHAM